MADRPSLDEIFGSKPSRPSLDEIFAEPEKPQFSPAAIAQVRDNVAKSKEMSLDKFARYSNAIGSGAEEGMAQAAEAGVHGVSSGFSDEIQGAAHGLGYGIGSLLPSSWTGKDMKFSDAVKLGYRKERDNARERMDEAKEASPYAATTMDIIGSAVSPINKISGDFVGKAAGPIGRILRGGLAGAAEGAIAGAGNSRSIDEMGEDVLRGADWGLAIGAGIPAAGATLNLLNKGAKKLAPVARDIADKWGFSRLFTRTGDEIADGIAGMAPTATGSMENLGSAVKKGADKGTEKIAKTQEHLYNRAYRNADMLGEAVTDRSRGAVRNVWDETASGGKKYLKKTFADLGGNADNLANVKEAGRNIERQFNRGKDFVDVSFGEIPAERIKNVPGLSDVVSVKDGKLVIPANKMEHIYNRRILNDGLSPREVASLMENVFHGEASALSPGGNPFSLMASNAQNAPTGVGFLVPDINQSGVNAVDTVFPKNPKEIGKKISNAMEGRTAPSFGQRNTSAPGSQRISALHGADSIVPNSSSGVNPNIRELQALKRQIGQDVASGNAYLTPNQEARLYGAIAEDVRESVFKNARPGMEAEAVSNLRLADAYTSAQKSTDSPLRMLENYTKNGDAVAGAKALRQASKRAENLKALKALFKKSPNRDEIAQEMIAQIGTRKQFNDLSGKAKELIYRTKLKEAEKLFNGAWGDRAGDMLLSASKKLDRINVSPYLVNPVVSPSVRALNPVIAADGRDDRMVHQVSTTKNNFFDEDERKKRK